MKNRTEFAIVIVVAFGWLVWTNVAPFFQAPLVAPANFNLTAFMTSFYVRLIVFEIVVLVGLGALLYRRGWRAADLGLTFRWTDPLWGFAIYAVYWSLYIVLLGAYVSLPGADTELAPPRFGNLAMGLIIVVSIINPVFEEVFVVGYIVSCFRRWGGTKLLAVAFSTGVRVAYHLSYGMIAMIAFLPFGVICAWWFARTQRLWPLIVAHMLSDFVGLLAYASPTG